MFRFLVSMAAVWLGAQGEVARLVRDRRPALIGVRAGRAPRPGGRPAAGRPRGRGAELLWRLCRVVRYEAHLGRQLTAGLHELEALQARRRGQHGPLLRVDVAAQE